MWDAGEGPTGWSNESRHQLAMVRMMDSTAGMEALMGVPFALRTVADGDAATVAPLPPNLRMLITEYDSYNVVERSSSAGCTRFSSRAPPSTCSQSRRWTPS